MKAKGRKVVLLTSSACLGMAVGYLQPGPQKAREEFDPRAASALADPAQGTVFGIEKARGAGLEGSGVDDEFVEWLRGASTDEIRARILEESSGPFGTLSFRGQILMRQLLREDGSETYQFFRRHDAKHNLLVAIFHLWGALEPRACVEASLDYVRANGRGRGDHIVHAGMNWLARESVEEAFTLASKFPRGSRAREMAFMGLLTGYAHTAPADMASLVDRVKKEGGKLDYGLASWARFDREGAVAWVRANMKKNGEVPVPMLSVIAEEDPRGALEFHYELNQLGETRRYGGYIESYLGSYMDQDLDGAIAWLKGKGLSPEREDALLNRAVSNLSWKNPDLLFESLIEGHPEVSGRARWSSARGQLAQLSAEELGDVLERVSDDQRLALQNELMSQGVIEPSEELLQERLQSEYGLSDAGVLAALMRDPERLEQLLEEMPTEQRLTALNHAASGLVRLDPETVLAQAEQFENPAEFLSNGAQQALVAIAMDDPVRGRALVEGLADPKARRLGIQNFVSVQLMNDPQETLEWLQGQRAAFEGDTFSDFVRGLRYRVPWEEARIVEVFGE